MIVPTKDLSGYALLWLISGAFGCGPDDSEGITSDSHRQWMLSGANVFVKDFTSRGYFGMGAIRAVVSVNDEVFYCADRRDSIHRPGDPINTKGSTMFIAILRWIATYYHGNSVDIPDDIMVASKLMGDL